MKNISQLGLSFPIYGKIKIMFQITNQNMNFPMLITLDVDGDIVVLLGDNTMKNETWLVMKIQGRKEHQNVPMSKKGWEIKQRKCQRTYWKFEEFTTSFSAL